jgi:hypothetical protein
MREIMLKKHNCPQICPQRIAKFYQESQITLSTRDNLSNLPEDFSIPAFPFTHTCHAARIVFTFGDLLGVFS